LKVLLPENFYDGFDIINSVDDLYFYLLSTQQQARKSDEAFAELVKNASDQILDIKKSSEDYKNMLIDAYKKSYL
jgi:hypothetical protein